MRGYPPVLVLALCLWSLPGSAEVYQVLGREMASLASVLELAVQPGGERRLVLNGQPLRAQLSHTGTPPGELLQRLLARYGRDDADALRRPLRISGEGWQVLAAVDLTGTGDTPDALVIVLPTREPDRHAVWSLSFQHPGGFRALLRASAAPEVPGPSLQALPLPGGSRRIFSLSQRDDHGDAHVLGYRHPGSVTETVAHFRRLLGDGVSTLTEAPDAAVLYARHGRQQIGLRISTAPAGEVLSILQIQQRPDGAP